MKDENDDVNNARTVLIVEDDEGLSHLISRSLKKVGFDVEVVHSGAEAIDRIVNDMPDLTLLDFILPDMTASEMIKDLKERNLEVPFIIMTGHGDEGLAVEMMKAGARDYVVKQGDFFELLPSVIKWIFGELQSEKKLVQANKALEVSENKYRHLVDNALVGVYRSGINGDILYANNALSDMFGYESPDEMMTANDLQIYKNNEVRDDLLNKLNESGNVGGLECECIKKDGSRIDVIFTATLEDNVISGMVIDITSRKDMEKLLIQSEKLKAMGVMAAGIAHDFNNVLAIINGHAQLLEDSGNDNDELSHGLRIINKAVDDGAETVRRLTDFTRMEKSTSRYVSVNMVEIVEEAIDFSAPKWKDMAHVKNVTYDLRTEGLKAVPDVLGNPSELREVVINMINNALYAMPEGGYITLRTWDENTSVYMGISDSGSGMSKEVQEKVFDPFYTTKGVDGSGLGMSVAYGIIRRHGGNIDLTSEEGNGTAFTIELPVATETVLVEAPREQTIDIKADNHRILVADDVKEISEVLYMFLSKRGYHVDSVENGDDAIKLLENGNYDLLLCDLGMPDVSGWDVIKVAKSLDIKPKVGLITGWADTIDSLEGDAMGFDFIISKPIKLKILWAQIREILSEESQ